MTSKSPCRKSSSGRSLVQHPNKNAAYPKAIDEMRASVELSESVERQNKYLNNLALQDHRFIKRLTFQAWDSTLSIQHDEP